MQKKKSTMLPQAMIAICIRPILVLLQAQLTHMNIGGLALVEVGDLHP
jgi:hypothetical protein